MNKLWETIIMSTSILPTTEYEKRYDFMEDTTASRTLLGPNKYLDNDYWRTEGLEYELPLKPKGSGKGGNKVRSEKWTSTEKILIFAGVLGVLYLITKN